MAGGVVAPSPSADSLATTNVSLCSPGTESLPSVTNTSIEPVAGELTDSQCEARGLVTSGVQPSVGTRLPGEQQINTMGHVAGTSMATGQQVGSPTQTVTIVKLDSGATQMIRQQQQPQAIPYEVVYMLLSFFFHFTFYASAF